MPDLPGFHDDHIAPCGTPIDVGLFDHATGVYPTAHYLELTAQRFREHDVNVINGIETVSYSPDIYAVNDRRNIVR